MLERQLVMYISTEEFAKPFDLSVVPVITQEESDAQALRALTEMVPVEAPVAADKPKVASSEPGPVESGWQKYSKTLSEVPEFKGFGPLLKSSLKPVELTEKETEYAVTAIKHIFQDHVVLQVFKHYTLCFHLEDGC
jgi:coatomer protein complex subunit gamma